MRPICVVATCVARLRIHRMRALRYSAAPSSWTTWPPNLSAGPPTAAPNYTLRSMPRPSPRAKPELARETSGAGVRTPDAQASTKRLSKRVVQKPDGRYLIYFEKI
jgi:hypothetical protein